MRREVDCLCGSRADREHPTVPRFGSRLFVRGVTCPLSHVRVEFGADRSALPNFTTSSAATACSRCSRAAKPIEWVTLYRAASLGRGAALLGRRRCRLWLHRRCRCRCSALRFLRHRE